MPRLAAKIMRPWFGFMAGESQEDTALFLFRFGIRE
jgi:hypothetical protein